ncbi:hypothetical protein DFH09DRAFT_1311706 [Mycena vulgaris]|nr:hypothetical protein DFH09DRAFT_1311706 [Mycena vulgaris]
MLSIFSIFILELVAFRWGTAKLEWLGLRHAQTHTGTTWAGSHAAHGPEGAQTPPKAEADLEAQRADGSPRPSESATATASEPHPHQQHTLQN